MVRRVRTLGRPAVLLPIGLFAFALLLRLIGVDWHGQHPDEDISGPARVLAGDLHLHSFYYPPLLTYLVAIGDVVLFALGLLLGWWHSTAELRAAYFNDSTPFFVTARVVVAICSAIAAPIAWALARQIRLPRTAALLAGLAAILSPGAIYFAHIAKSDSGLAPAYLLALLCALRMIERPSSLSRPIQLGIAVGLAVSFKQSALFFLVPAFAFLVPWSLYESSERPVLIRSWAVAIAASSITAALLNIAILADPTPFLAAQAVQSQMSFRPASLQETMKTSYMQLVGPNVGLPVVALIVAPTLWMLGIVRGHSSVRLLLVVMGIGCAGASIIICSVGGSRQPLQLWLPSVVLGVVAAAIGAGTLVGGSNRVLRVLGYAGFAVLVASTIVRIVPILTQATAPPLAARLATVIRRAAPPEAKIVSNVDLSPYLPLSPESQTLPRARHERLAKHYGIVLPPPDRPLTGIANGYTIIDFPWVIGGLEDYRPDQVKVVVPYAWPLQPDEWQLSSWLDQGFHHFVVSDAARLRDNPVPAYRNLFRSIDQCVRIASVPATRPLFGEHDAGIYRCD